MTEKNNKSKLPLLLILLLVLVIVGLFIIMNMYEPEEPAVPVVATTTQTTVPETTKETLPDFDIKDDNLILVNKTHTLESDYRPDDLVRISYYISGRSEEMTSMRPEAASAFDDLVEDAADDGYTIKATSAFRSYSYQQTLHSYYLKTKGQEWTEQYSAVAGASEHQTGLAVDVSSPSVNFQLQISYGETSEGKWLAKHAHEYGFILRYQKGKEDITGYAYEPWHIRYVGEAAAKVIYEKDLTLEEFIREIE